MNLFLVRHGNIDYSDRIPGRQSGLHLSLEGEKQALTIAERMRNIPVSSIYSSPMERAVETATPVAKEKKLRIQIIDELNEIDFGKWTGKTFANLDSEEKWKLFHYYRNGCIIPDGELMIQVQKRVVNFIGEIFSTEKNNNVVIVSHNDPIKSLIAYFAGISLDQFLRLSVNTGSISLITLNEKMDSTIKFINSLGEIHLAPA